MNQFKFFMIKKKISKYNFFFIGTSFKMRVLFKE